MPDSFIQLPADSTGKQLDTVTVNMGVGTTSVHREKVVIADPSSTSAFAVVTSSQGLQVSSTQVQTISGTVTVLSASSGLVQISGTPAVTSTSVVLSSAGLTQISGTVTVLSASSGLVQISGIPTITSTSVLLTTGSIISLSSGTVNVSGTVTVLSASSGLVQISGTPTILSASSGLVQAFQTGTWTVQTTAGTSINTSSAMGLPSFHAITPTSSVAGASLAPVTSSAGLLASLSSGTVTLSSAHVVSLSSGTVTLSSQITVTATGPVTVTSGLISVTSGTITSTAATNPWSSAPGFNIPTVSVSSGLNQVSAIQVSPTSSVAGAGLLVVTSSFGLITQSTQPITVTSGTVTLSSVHTVTATAGTNPWSSAPGFNLPVVTVSSGLLQISGTIVSASSGLVQISGTPIVTATAATNPWSSAPGFNLPVVSVSSGITQSFVQGSTGVLAIVTSSGALLVSGTPGSVSTAVNIIGATTGIFAPVTSSFGLLVNSTQPVTITSGLISVTSGTITSTAGTNPWSSAPGFNMPVVNVSSGFIRSFPIGAVTSSGLTMFHRMSTGGAVASVITTAVASLYGYMCFNSSAVPRAVKFYNSTAPTVGGSTASLQLTVLVPGSTGGGGANLSLPVGLYSSVGWSCIITAGMGDTDTGAPGTNDISCGVAYQT